MANYRANRLVCEAADRAMQIHGGIGYSRHEPFEHIYRHHRRYRITEGAEGDPDAAGGPADVQVRQAGPLTWRPGTGRRADRGAAPLLGADTGVDNLRALTGGASRTTWAFDAVTGPDRRALILRTAPPDDIHAGMELEAAVQGGRGAAGAPVPHVLVASGFGCRTGQPVPDLRRDRR